MENIEVTPAQIDRFISNNKIGEIISSSQIAHLAEIVASQSRGDISEEQTINALISESDGGNKFNFNYNTSIQRLLICKYPKKLTFSSPFDAYGQNICTKDKNSLFYRGIAIKAGLMTKGKQYETQRINELKKQIAEIASNSTIFGLYGQLSFPSDTCKENIRKKISTLFDQLPNNNIAICQSGSKLGISGIAYEEAIKRGYPIIGIIPKSIEHLKDKNQFSLLISEGDDWGDASFIFGGIPDQIVFAGGGYWSFLEYIKAREQNKPIVFLESDELRYCKEFNEDRQKTINALIK